MRTVEAWQVWSHRETTSTHQASSGTMGYGSPTWLPSSTHLPDPYQGIEHVRATSSSPHFLHLLPHAPLPSSPHAPSSLVRPSLLMHLLALVSPPPSSSSRLSLFLISSSLPRLLRRPPPPRGIARPLGVREGARLERAGPALLDVRARPARRVAALHPGQLVRPELARDVGPPLAAARHLYADSVRLAGVAPKSRSLKLQMTLS